MGSLSISCSTVASCLRASEQAKQICAISYLKMAPPRKRHRQRRRRRKMEFYYGTLCVRRLTSSSSPCASPRLLLLLLLFQLRASLPSDKSKEPCIQISDYRTPVAVVVVIAEKFILSTAAGSTSSSTLVIVWMSAKTRLPPTSLAPRKPKREELARGLWQNLRSPPLGLRLVASIHNRLELAASSSGRVAVWMRLECWKAKASRARALHKIRAAISLSLCRISRVSSLLASLLNSAELGKDGFEISEQTAQISEDILRPQQSLQVACLVAMLEGHELAFQIEIVVDFP